MNDRATELELLYIDDLVEEMLDALEGKEHHCEYQELDPVADESGKYGYVPTTHKATLGEIVDLLEMFKNQPKSLLMPEIPNNLLQRNYIRHICPICQKRKSASLLR